METNQKNARNAQNILCEYCNVICRSISVFNKHQTTAKHIRLINANTETNEKRADVGNPKDPTSSFYCDICKFSTTKQSNWNIHLVTSIHLRRLRDNSNSINNEHICECGKTYKHGSSLCKHRRTCSTSIAPTSTNQDNINNTPNSDDMLALFMDFVREKTQDKSDQSNLLIELVKQNAEFKELLIDQNKQMIELAKNAGHNTTNNNNTTNNKFNLNFFLNETCKDAITMSDFINSIEVTLEDFIQTGNIGFVDGISKVMVERIKVMDLHTRPMHCTDLKRETLYIKNDEKWEKEDNDKTLLRKAVKNIANKNYNKLTTWYNNSKPAVEIIGSEDCENYFKYYKAALGGYDKEEDKKFEEKIIKNVLKEVLLNKDAAERKKEG